MKVVINRCFGGFSLSPAGIARYAELKGRPCYFFTKKDIFKVKGKYKPTCSNEVSNTLFFYAFDISDPNTMLPTKSWGDMTAEERVSYNNLYEKHVLPQRPDDRADPDLVKVVEELGDKANGSCANLEIVEIPDDIEWEIEEHDGNEHVAEKHRIW